MLDDESLSSVSVQEVIQEFERKASRSRISCSIPSTPQTPHNRKRRTFHNFGGKRFQVDQDVTPSDDEDYGTLSNVTSPYFSPNAPGKCQSPNSPVDYRQLGRTDSRFMEDSPMKVQKLSSIIEPTINYSSFEKIEGTFMEESPLRAVPLPLMKPPINQEDSDTAETIEDLASDYEANGHGDSEAELLYETPMVKQRSPTKEENRSPLQQFKGPTSPVKPILNPLSSVLPPRPKTSNPLMNRGRQDYFKSPDYSDAENFSDANKTDISDMTDHSKSNRSDNFSGVFQHYISPPPPPPRPQQYYAGAINATMDNSDLHSVISNLSSPGDIISVAGSNYYTSPQNIRMTSPGSIVSITSIQDNQDCLTMKKYLQETVGCTEAFANQYSNILIKNGVPSIEILRRRLIRNEEFLLDIGFDEYLALDIVDILLKQNQPYQDNDSISRVSSSVRGRSGQKQQGRGRTSVSAGSVGGRESIFFNDSFLPFSASRTIRGSTNGISYRTNGSNNTDDGPMEIAKLYNKALNNIQDKIALNQLIAYADDGNYFAEGFLMRLYALGLGGVEKDLNKAKNAANKLLPWIKEVIHETEFLPTSLQSMYCKYFFGVCYAEGLGVVQDLKEAFLWTKLSAEQGYDAAQAYIGSCYYYGKGIVKELIESVKWYRMAASQGYAGAQCNLGICYELGEGVPKDAYEAVRWYQLAAAQGNATAQYNLGLCYENGKGIHFDIHCAFGYYEMAANQEHPIAQFTLGLMFMNGGSSHPVEPNDDLAFHWLRRSATHGYAKAQTYLGICYEKGIGCERNYELAANYYQLASNQGEITAHYYLGFAYFNGLGVKQNHELAIKYYTLAAEKGHAAAQNNLGFCCYQGIGGRKNYTQAIHWYRKAAEQGYAPAQYNIGYCYEKGYGVPKRQKETVKWFRLAAEHGHAKAKQAIKKYSI